MTGLATRLPDFHLLDTVIIVVVVIIILAVIFSRDFLVLESHCVVLAGLEFAI